MNKNPLEAWLETAPDKGKHIRRVAGTMHEMLGVSFDRYFDGTKTDWGRLYDDACRQHEDVHKEIRAEENAAEAKREARRAADAKRREEAQFKESVGDTLRRSLEETPLRPAEDGSRYDSPLRATIRKAYRGEDEAPAEDKGDPGSVRHSIKSAIEELSAATP